MRKIIVFMLILSLLLTGCAREDRGFITALKFYYPLQNADYSMGASYLQPELREGGGLDKSVANILNHYLEGPADLETYRMPFQYNTKVVSISREIGILNVTLSSGFATYTDLDLIIACACITMTCLELSDAQTIRIRAQDATLDGAEFIEMSKSSLLLIDFAPSVEE